MKILEKSDKKHTISPMSNRSVAYARKHDLFYCYDKYSISLNLFSKSLILHCNF